MRGIFRFTRRYMFPYWLWYGGGILALIATNAISVEIPLYLMAGIDALPLGAEGRPIIWRSSVAVALMGCAVIGVRLLSRVLFFTPGRLVEAQVKRDLFARLLIHQPTFLRQWPTGDLISRVQTDVTYLRLLAGFSALQVFNTFIAVGLTAAQMIRLSPSLTIWLVLPVGGALLFMQLFLRRLFEIMRRMQLEAAALSDQALSSFQGVATIQGFVAEEPFTEHFDSINRDYLKTTLQRAHIRTFLGPTLSLAAALNVAVLLFVGGPMALEGTLTIGEFVAFVTLVAYLTAPLRSLSFLLSLFKQAQAALERIDAVMDPEPERPDLPDPTPAPHRPPALSIRNLSFSYPDEPETLVLDGISVDIASGETLGIVGLTGSGKSTLLRCLARLYNPPRGTVWVDGADLLDIDLDGWRRSASLVPQRAFLFSETLRDNVLLGQDNEALLDRVIGLTALRPDIEALPKGVLTQVGESGVMLSGGQRQRVALARGLIRENHVLMLDDVLSAVDHATEQELIASLRGVDGSERPTTLIVAHRISALRHADQILVLDSGRVEACGTHDELVDQPGLYQDIWQRQSDENAHG